MNLKNPYGRSWKEARARYLSRHSCCHLCLQRGIVEPATVVDHVRPWRSGATEEERSKLFNDPANWQGAPIPKGESDLYAADDGKYYVVLSNANGILAVFRVRNDDMLKRLKRWPSELTAKYKAHESLGCLYEYDARVRKAQYQYCERNFASGSYDEVGDGGSEAWRTADGREIVVLTNRFRGIQCMYRILKDDGIRRMNEEEYPAEIVAEYAEE